MVNPGIKYRRVKPDITPYLFHFINGNDNTPDYTLERILEEKRLTSNRGFICFTASPVTSMDAFFKTKMYGKDHPMYHPFGIGFSRDILIRDYGARNLMYCSADEISGLSDDMKWRVDLLNVESYDFEWLREWRIKGNEFDFSEFPPDDIIVIAPTANNLLNITVKEEPDIHITGNPITGEVDYYMEEAYKREWKGFTLKQIGKHCDDFSLSGATATQVIGVDMVKDIIDTVENG